MTDYSATTLDVDELKQMARRSAANAIRTLNAPWTYTVKEYETVEKQHKTGGFIGFMQQTVTTTERVESSKETQILGEHWLLDSDPSAVVSNWAKAGSSVRVGEK